VTSSRGGTIPIPTRNLGSNFHFSFLFLSFLFFLARGTLSNLNLNPQLHDTCRQLELFKELGPLRSSESLLIFGAMRTRSGLTVQDLSFIIHKNFRRCDIGVLLQDASNRLRANHCCSLLTAAPAGLFNRGGNSGLWNPLKYLEKV